ncbi:MAG TPA: asparagine synthase C-terminal domain-containing protein, partial [Saprospiraceae bacterium]|nr:asparagine synthase C-terminal domain-containing protein [Saprospiraceae bacterium]
IQGSLNTYEPISILENSLKNIALDEDLLNKMLYLELKYFLPDHNLNYTDKMSMATGVEVRVPFLDYELVEMSTKIPVEFKMKNSNPKYILKKLAEKYLPKDIIYRSKTGFGAPVRKWIVEDLDEMVQDRLSQKNVSFYEIFDYKAVKKIIADNKAGCIDASYSILSLLAIDSWLRQFNNQS